VYVRVQDVHRYRVPDYDAPYVTMVTDNMELLAEQLTSQRQETVTSEILFKRLVKDLYRKMLVMVVGRDDD